MRFFGEADDDHLKFGVSWELLELNPHTAGQLVPTHANWDLGMRQLETRMQAMLTLQSFLREASQKAFSIGEEQVAGAKVCVAPERCLEPRDQSSTFGMEICLRDLWP